MIDSPPAAPPTVVRGYRFEPVYGRVAPALRQEIVALWLAAGVLPEDEARRRVDEVVIAIRNPAGELAGVNTAYVRGVTGGSGSWYFYRTFVRPEDRGVPGVVSGALRVAIETLRAYPHPEHPRGVVAVIENPKLANRGPMRRMDRLGLHRIGQDAAGRDVWCIKFDGTVPVAPPGLLRQV
ncbi:MAG: hypothetical protein ABI585_06440 [Betaproteobacteria bacterium]